MRWARHDTGTADFALQVADVGGTNTQICIEIMISAMPTTAYGGKRQCCAGFLTLLATWVCSQHPRQFSFPGQLQNAVQVG